MPVLSFKFNLCYNKRECSVTYAVGCEYDNIMEWKGLQV